ncbi:hypothetical protein NDU88_005088 [Pleurodeles waltl]|uniref:Uncharacterized protein n=1 Tax=Pleurodeles waltl TaxID=8319 RepID=A0AAV7SKP4_PLEWA|nr:hypothetical protein NDU88_005088 [Pleurodeles waltl]
MDCEILRTLWRGSGWVCLFVLFCPGIQSFWEELFQALEIIMTGPLPMGPLLALLGYDRDVTGTVSKLVAIGVLLAQCRIAMRWARGPVPTITEQHTNMTYCNIQSDN